MSVGRKSVQPDWLLGAACVFLLALISSGCGEANPSAILSGEAFGARYHITLPGSHPEAYIAHQHITDLLNEIDEQASAWRDDSWVSRFNRNPSLEPAMVPEHVWAMLVVGESVYQDSGGAFDLTAGPLVELWGFGANPRTDPGAPSEMQIAVALVHSGMDQIVLDREAGTVAKRTPRVALDLSGLAKGYAIDRIGEMLRVQGYDQYLVEFGGEVLARDLSMSGEGWAVEIGDGSGSQARRELTLRNQAVATSGTAYRSRDLADGQRVSHLIDPRTGKPVNGSTRSVTVVASSGVLADAWATALAVDQTPGLVEAAGRAGAQWVDAP
ncbi:MAG: FAD:protein FMN transferase [Phycisphaeraceae bacterium]|nr:FAD:protein FMN transferase [Phycisphaeraceae bacterium]